MLFTFENRVQPMRREGHQGAALFITDDETLQ